MVERDGKMRAGPIPNLSADTLETIVRGHVGYAKDMPNQYACP